MRSSAGQRYILDLDLARPRALWLMVPAAIMDKTIALLEPGEILIDGGN